MEITLTKTTIQVTTDQGEVLAEYPRPMSGSWVFNPVDGLTIYTGQALSANEYAATFNGKDMVPIAYPTDEGSFKPLKDITFAQAKTFVAGLTNAQLRDAVAWLIWIKRDQLPDDIRNRV